MLFNETLPRVGALFTAPTRGDIPTVNLRRAMLPFARERTTSYVRRVLDAIEEQLERRHRFALVEVRVSEIREGLTPGLPGWHIDTVGDARHPSRPEVHHLLVTGTASLTEFVAEPLDLELPEGVRDHALMAALAKQVERRGAATWHVPSSTLVTYGRFHLHRATPGLFDERRLLVRVTETDVLRPEDREVYLGGRGGRIAFTAPPTSSPAPCSSTPFMPTE